GSRSTDSVPGPRSRSKASSYSSRVPDARVITKKNPRERLVSLRGFALEMGLGRVELPTSRLSGPPRHFKSPAPCRFSERQSHDPPTFVSLACRTFDIQRAHERAQARSYCHRPPVQLRRHFPSGRPVRHVESSMATTNVFVRVG